MGIIIITLLDILLPIKLRVSIDSLEPLQSCPAFDHPFHEYVHSTTTSHASLRTLVAPVDLLLEDNTVDTRLEQSKGQTRLAFQFAQSVENFGTGVRSEVIDGRSQL